MALNQERRSDDRTICAGATVIDVLSPKPRSAVNARILDVGPSSLKLSVPFYLCPGALIRIHMTGSFANAEVRHCTRKGAEYFAGVRIEEINPISV
jgi:hypothetical protein